MKKKATVVYSVCPRRLLSTIMKTFIFLLCTTVFGLNGETSFPQEKVTIKQSQLVKVEKVFKIIKQQTNYRFLYPKVLFNNAPKVQLKKGEILVTRLLEQSLSTKDLDYQLSDNNTIVIKVKPVISNVQQQGVQVSGTIMDSDGMPLPGANVVEKNTNNGVLADFDGNFMINVANSDAILVVSYIGYKSKDVTVGNQKTIKINLEVDAANLEEVVVVGYGSMRKKDLTGAVVQVKPDKLANENPQTVQDVLRGVPGLKVGYSSDAKGGGSLQVRGQTSVYSGGGHNSPLIILDGMQFYGELSEINPDDIGQIDVLKDASATAVYGSKASAGVIIITSKKGKRGKPVINVNSNIAINTKSAYREVYDVDGYAKYRDDWETTKTYDVNPATGTYEAYMADRVGQIGYFSNPNNLSKYGISEQEWLAYQPATETDEEV